MRLIVLSLLAMWVWSSWAAQVEAQNIFSKPTKDINGKVNPEYLRELLVKGLKATRENEKVYLDWVVGWVEKDKLPVSLVYASFQYSRKRRPDYPFPYFVYSLETLIVRNKIVLEDD